MSPAAKIFSLDRLSVKDSELASCKIMTLQTQIVPVPTSLEQQDSIILIWVSEFLGKIVMIIYKTGGNGEFPGSYKLSAMKFFS